MFFKFFILIMNSIHDIHDVMLYTEAPQKDRVFATSFEFKQ